MLWALGQPVALAGLLAAFLAALVLRAVVQHAIARRGNRGYGYGREPLLNLRRDVDVFGAVAALLGGTGWGKRAPHGADGRPSVAVLLSGPAAVLVASQIVFAVYRLAGGDTIPLRLHFASEFLHGVPGDPLAQLVLSFAVGLLCFGLLALVPLPPLDGWGLLERRAGNRPGPGFAKAKHWLDDQNIGVVILLVGLVIPLVGGPLFLFLLDVITAPILRLWA